MDRSLRAVPRVSFLFFNLGGVGRLVIDARARRLLIARLDMDVRRLSSSGVDHILVKVRGSKRAQLLGVFLLLFFFLLFILHKLSLVSLS